VGTGLKTSKLPKFRYFPEGSVTSSGLSLLTTTLKVEELSYPIDLSTLRSIDA
jgi:hypothetical protein